MAVNEQYPSLMSTLYPGVMATRPKPFTTLDAMWLTCQSLASNKTFAINVFFFFRAYLFVGRAVIRPFGAPARQRAWPGPDPFPVAYTADELVQ